MSILKNNITAVFNSDYLRKNTSSLYNFNSKIIIPNFLTSHFQNLKLNMRRNPHFVWSVQRTKGLKDIVDIWIKKINPINSKAKFFIFGISNSKIETYDLKKLKKYNIFFKGRVNRSTLKKYYLNSMGMICLGYDETFCLNIIEAYSCGLPVISFGYTAVDEITDKKNSFIMNDYSDFHKIFLSILYLKPNIRKNMIKYCVNYSKKFYLKNVFNKWLKILSL